MSDAKVNLWGRMIGAVSWLEDRQVSVFQYTPGFVGSNIQLSPLMMPLNEFPYEFPTLARNTFRGLPGLLADSLPDKFGNTLIDAWLTSQGRPADSFNPVERLCYIGRRGMGALEFEPAILEPSSKIKEVEVSKLVALANKILDQRKNLNGLLTGDDDLEVMEDILRVGTSAGGARAKAILAWNPATNEFRSGQIDIEQGFEHWLLKFDGITNNRDKELSDPQGYGKIEYAYHLMALKAGIEMTACRLHHEGGRSHFMTKRFDRYGSSGKYHMQSLGALAHFDYNQPASYSYEQSLQTMKRLGLSREELEQQVLRAIFNVVGRNQDDHVKNIAFLMNRKGAWRLSPAFDVSYAYDPKGDWTGKHQMSINGKRDFFNREDILSLANIGGIKIARANEILKHVIESIKLWPDFAEKAGVSEKRMLQIQTTHRLEW
ncbi:MAG: type II toxin-antitoxin system HipA family toxin [Anaerolineaceae bacterium]|nr:type II toxin-antitoxin system HipA family toxin [Anaerolineaceae bacterium]